MPFTSFGLADPLVQGVIATGYTAPTEIQSQAIPIAIDGQDIIGCAQTGTGKTAAFVLPILNRLARQRAGRKNAIRSLILTPTRELAIQIEQSIVGYSRFLQLRTLAIYGGVSIENQLKALRRGVDIVVCTPGRLLDHMQRGSISFQSIEVLVLDEADRMLDMGFIRDVRKIVAALPTDRQTMLFSATISPEIESLSAGMQKSPRRIQVGRQQNPAETVTQHVHRVEKQQKMDLLLHMLKTRSMYSVLVFSRTKHGADKITRKLARSGIESISIHSGRSQGQRQRALDGFKNGKYQVMVATDIAARGIDVSGISHVINYDVPAFAEDYVHRIGRTGRAAATGDAITFVSTDEKKYLQQIEKFIGQNLRPQDCPGFTCAASAPTPAEPRKSPPSRQRKSKASVSAHPSPVRAKSQSVRRRRRRKARSQSA